MAMQTLVKLRVFHNVTFFCELAFWPRSTAIPSTMLIYIDFYTCGFVLDFHVYCKKFQEIKHGNFFLD